MKITALHTLPVQPRWLFVKIETDEGITGWGECLGDKAFVIAEAVRSYEHALIGQDPRRITHHWQSLYRGAFWRGGPTLNAAISGIEIALWDILGKSLGVPVGQLLAGPCATESASTPGPARAKTARPPKCARRRKRLWRAVSTQ